MVGILTRKVRRGNFWFEQIKRGSYTCPSVQITLVALAEIVFPLKFITIDGTNAGETLFYSNMALFYSQYLQFDLFYIGEHECLKKVGQIQSWKILFYDKILLQQLNALENIIILSMKDKCMIRLCGFNVQFLAFTTIQWWNEDA